METPCERPKTVEIRRSDCMERGKNVTGNAALSYPSINSSFRTVSC